MNILARQPDLDAALEYLRHTRPLVLLPAFLPNLTHRQNRARTRELAGEVHIAANGGHVFTGRWEDASQDALVAPRTKLERRTGAIPPILESWLKLFKRDCYFFRAETDVSLLFIAEGSEPQTCHLDENRISLSSNREFTIDAAYQYPGFFGAWSLKAGIESGDRRVWDYLF